MIGYVVLIAIAITVSAITYSWLETYIPQDKLECPDGVSVYIKNLDCKKIGNELTLNITLENNGKFNFSGYFIRATNSSNQTVASIDLSENITSGGNPYNGFVLFTLAQPLTPSEVSKPSIFKVNLSEFGMLYKVEIIPLRVQEEDSVFKSLGCSKAKVTETIYEKCGP